MEGENTSRFNLIDEPWIPVRFSDGRTAELGIRETLLAADRIAEIQDASPLVVAALHRFLLAVLYRALEGPTDIQQAKTLFKEGLPADKIDDYLCRWRDRFWLFDNRFPFGQIPSYEPRKWHAWPVLAAEHNASNAKVLFDHVDVRNAGSIPPSQATRWLLALQSFALGGGNSDFVYTKSAPSATGVMALPIGRHLEETLLFSLVPQNRAVQANDIPLWERLPETSAVLKNGLERSNSGFADLYLWRTRSVRLKESEHIAVKSSAFASGIGYVATQQLDPMLAYEVSENNGRLPLRFKERGFWRDFDSLVPNGSDCAPRVMEHAVRLCREGKNRASFSVLILGQANSKAKIEYWRLERFIFPVHIAESPFLRTQISKLLPEADQTAHVFERALKVMAKLTIAKGNRELQPDKWVNGKWVPGDVSKFIGKYASEVAPTALTTYWATLEQDFHVILHMYATDNCIEDRLEDISLFWLKSVRDACRSSWDQYVASLVIKDAWVIRALAKAEGTVFGRLATLNQEISKLERKRPADPPVKPPRCGAISRFSTGGRDGQGWGTGSVLARAR